MKKLWVSIKEYERVQTELAVLKEEYANLQKKCDELQSGVTHKTMVEKYESIKKNYEVAMGSARQIRAAYVDYQKEKKEEIRILKQKLTKAKNKIKELEGE